MREAGITGWENLKYLDSIGNLKKSHQYYHQITCYMGLAKCSKTLFYVYTPKGSKLLIINFDLSLYESIKRDVQTYYTRFYLSDFF